MSRVRATIPGTVEATLFLDPADFVGMSDLDVIVAVQRELGNGAHWDDSAVVHAATTIMQSASVIARESGGRG